MSADEVSPGADVGTGNVHLQATYLDPACYRN
jgi:hypothetical protein